MGRVVTSWSLGCVMVSTLLQNLRHEFDRSSMCNIFHFHHTHNISMNVDDHFENGASVSPSVTHARHVTHHVTMPACAIHHNADRVIMTYSHLWTPPLQLPSHPPATRRQRSLSLTGQRSQRPYGGHKASRPAVRVQKSGWCDRGSDC